MRINKCFKKTIALLLAGAMCTFLPGCGEESGDNTIPDSLMGEAIRQEGDGSGADETAMSVDAGQNVLSADEGESISATDAGQSTSLTEEGESVSSTEAGQSTGDVTAINKNIMLGDERFDEYLPLLEGKRVAVFSNQSGIVGNVVLEDDSEGDPDWINFTYGPHITDVLCSKGVKLSVIFSPEHGFSGTAGAGAPVTDSVLNGTNVAIISLYSGTENALNEDNMSRFDTLVVDIQDVGLRFYTYYITMMKLLESCAEYGKDVVILDRPNPNGFYVDGPVLKDGFTSGVGIIPIPIVHGMTLGELALMMNGEGWLRTGKDSCKITVITCENYKHSDHYELICRPSPNLKNMRAVYLYPSTCLFENTVISVGRGTNHPFEIYGSPYLAGVSGYDFAFTPENMEGADNPVYMGQTCFGRSLMETDYDHIFNEKIDLSYICDAYNAVKTVDPDISFFGNADGSGRYYIDLLCGTDEVRKAIERGERAGDIENSWQSEVLAFRERRKPYLLYEDID